jgi:hypothetical protein
MRFLILLFLLICFPIQSSWAVSAIYCQHEETTNAQHFGHHDHEHKDDQHSLSKLKSPAADSDCSVCHAGCLAALSTLAPSTIVIATFVVNSSRSIYATSPPGLQPERPNWLVSA